MHILTKIIGLLQIFSANLHQTFLHIYSKIFCISPSIIAVCQQQILKPYSEEVFSAAILQHTSFMFAGNILECKLGLLQASCKRLHAHTW